MVVVKAEFTSINHTQFKLMKTRKMAVLYLPHSLYLTISVKVHFFLEGTLFFIG